LYSFSNSLTVFLCGCQDERLDGARNDDAGEWGIGRNPPALKDVVDADANVCLCGGEMERVLVVLGGKVVSGVVNPRFMLMNLDPGFLADANPCMLLTLLP
jgi:hypothetical protein